MISIHTIPALTDNYIWLIEHTESKNCLIIDPGEASPVLDVLTQLHLTPLAILVTHHHPDHIDGIDEILSHYPIPVYGKDSARVSSITHLLSDLTHLSFTPSFPTISVLDIPGHTQIHSAFLIDNMLFCGDTLFGAGCGRLLGGTAQQLFQSLQAIKALPLNTKIYCSHEYTLANLQFAKTVEPNNTDIDTRIASTLALRQRNLPTVPSTLEIELQTNPFLRCDIQEIQHHVAMHQQCSLPSTFEVFKALRLWKDHF
jgi:hydroxyacylglutathione hydrolase